MRASSECLGELGESGRGRSQPFHQTGPRRPANRDVAVRPVESHPALGSVQLRLIRDELEALAFRFEGAYGTTFEVSFDGRITAAQCPASQRFSNVFRQFSHVIGGSRPLGSNAVDGGTGAEIMGRADEFGTVEVGKLADLLVVDGDVASDITLLEDRSRFIAVMQGGVIKAGQLTRTEHTWDNATKMG